MFNVFFVCNMIYRNEIRLVWFYIEYVFIYNDMKVIFGGGYNLYRYLYFICYFFLFLRLVFCLIVLVLGCIIFIYIKF